MMLLVSDGCLKYIKDYPTEYFGCFVEAGPKRWGVISKKALAKVEERKWAADNGAFSRFDEKKFRTLLERCEGLDNCLFVVAPDVVYDMEKTLDRFFQWQREIKAHGLPVALALQDGFSRETPVPWDSLDAIFVGGSTRFKYAPIVREIVLQAHQKGKWAHCGRVTGPSRLRYMRGIGVDSVDGSSFSRHKRHLKMAYRVLSELDGQETISATVGDSK